MTSYFHFPTFPVVVHTCLGWKSLTPDLQQKARNQKYHPLHLLSDSWRNFEGYKGQTIYWILKKEILFKRVSNLNPFCVNTQLSTSSIWMWRMLEGSRKGITEATTIFYISFSEKLLLYKGIWKFNSIHPLLPASSWNCGSFL